MIAAIASLAAAACALIAVRQTAQLRRDARQQILADALIDMINATEKNPGYGVDPVWDDRMLGALHKVQRACGLAVLGLSAAIKEPVIGLLEPSNQKNPDRMFMYATKAYEEMLAENGVRLTGPEVDGNSTLEIVAKRVVLRLSEALRRYAAKP